MRKILTRLRCIWIKSWLCAFTASGQSSYFPKLQLKTHQNSGAVSIIQINRVYISSWSYQRQSSSSSKTLTKTRQNTNTPRWSLLNIRSAVQILIHPVTYLKKKSIMRIATVNIILKWWTERLAFNEKRKVRFEFEWNSEKAESPNHGISFPSHLLTFNGAKYRITLIFCQHKFLGKGE